ncbi:MAG TPA: metalloregulator ArsR/SmtB family transcription factor [Solirubrobacteraceae bacterium]|jgi:DNA-binding transcriptional ArsR family regulator|nr:metalloregulator ArsR/SmtB family transcription factor [Solirubrobacteraceae bacterium]
MTEEHGELLHISRREGQALRRARPDAEAAARLARQHQALSDPTRLGLAMALLEDRELCVCDLSWIAERAQNLTSHHMKVLKSAGLVSARKEGKMVMYSLVDEGRRLLEASAPVSLGRRDAP